jgi:hypothetical protein
MKIKKYPRLSGIPRGKEGASGFLRPRGAALCLWIFFLIGSGLPAAPLYSPAWGFRLDPPEGYQFSGGNGKDRFSFRSPEGACLDLAVYSSVSSIKDFTEDLQRRLDNRGETSLFEYRKKQGALIKLQFDDPGAPGMNGAKTVNEGWALCVDLENPENSNGNGESGSLNSEGKPLLLALAYGNRDRENLQHLHLSALDSLVPSGGDRRAPGPVTEYAYPRGEVRREILPGLDAEVLIHEGDREAAQALVDREFAVLRLSADTALWREAWIRFYRAIYRDSFERLAETAFTLERLWNTGEGKDGDDRDFAEWVLAWVQSFAYERDRMGSDFVNLVSAAAENRGDCDSRALLWAVVLEQADIPAAIMVSRTYSHAMGLADLAGTGARFSMEEKQWLVAETTAAVPLGLINAKTSEISHWIGVSFED